MCDYDWSYEEISSRWIEKTRKPHDCGSCMGTFPAGSRMRVAVGLTDGDLGRTYACEACMFALNQPDETPLHLCWGWNWDGYGEGDDEEETWEYIDGCLKRGDEPTPDGVKAYLATLAPSDDE